MVTHLDAALALLLALGASRVALHRFLAAFPLTLPLLGQPLLPETQQSTNEDKRSIKIEIAAMGTMKQTVLPKALAGCLNRKWVPAPFLLATLLFLLPLLSHALLSHLLELDEMFALETSLLDVFVRQMFRSIEVGLQNVGRSGSNRNNRCEKCVAPAESDYFLRACVCVCPTLMGQVKALPSSSMNMSFIPRSAVMAFTNPMYSCNNNTSAVHSCSRTGTAPDQHPNSRRPRKSRKTKTLLSAQVRVQRVRVCLCVRLCVCVCVKERERERHTHTQTNRHRQTLTRTLNWMNVSNVRSCWKVEKLEMAPPPAPPPTADAISRRYGSSSGTSMARISPYIPNTRRNTPSPATRHAS